MSIATSPDDQLSGILDVLAQVAPEVRDVRLEPDRPLREQVELDSMDHLHFAVGLHERYGVDIPEADYRAMRTLGELAAYIQARRGRP